MNNSSALNGTNSSAMAGLGPPLAYTAVMSAALVLIIVVAVLGNSLVIYAFFSYHRLRHNVTNYFIVSLAVSDILTAFFVTTFELDKVIYFQWSHGEFLCHVWTFMYLLMVPGSVINLLAVTIDRFLVLRIPLRYTTLMTRRRATIAICVLWLYALVTALLPSLGWRMDHPKVIARTCYFLTTPAYSILVGICNFLLPMMFMGFFWTKIYAIAQTHAKRVRKLEQSLSVVENSLSQTDKSSRNSRVSISDENATTKKLFENSSVTSSCKKQFRRHLRGSKYIAILVGVFFLCWLPYTSTSLVAAINRDWYLSIPSPIWDVFLVMGYLNSALNPFLYPFHDRQFREAFRNIFKSFQQRTYSMLSKIRS